MTQRDELLLLFKIGKVINEHHTDLMGIIIEKMINSIDLFEKIIKVYNKELIKIEGTANKEEIKIELINTFDQTNLFLQESVEFQMRANVCQQRVMSLQKEIFIISVDK